MEDGIRWIWLYSANANATLLYARFLLAVFAVAFSLQFNSLARWASCDPQLEDQSIYGVALSTQYDVVDAFGQCLHFSVQFLLVFALFQPASQPVCAIALDCTALRCAALRSSLQSDVSQRDLASARQRVHHFHGHWQSDRTRNKE